MSASPSRFCWSGCEGYKKYVKYAWSDFVMRRALQKTFESRHADYSNGTKELDDLPYPEEWKTPSKPRSRRKSKTVKQKTSNPNPKSTVEVPAEYVYDSEEDEWVKVDNDS